MMQGLITGCSPPTPLPLAQAWPKSGKVTVSWVLPRQLLVVGKAVGARAGGYQKVCGALGPVEAVGAEQTVPQHPNPSSKTKTHTRIDIARFPVTFPHTPRAHHAHPTGQGSIGTHAEDHSVAAKSRGCDHLPSAGDPAPWVLDEHWASVPPISHFFWSALSRPGHCQARIVVP